MTDLPTQGLIVLDGPDCTGKSTLARHFVDRHGAKYYHATWNPELERIMWYYHTDLLYDAITTSKHRLVVIDRLWASEAIYGRVYRNGSKIPHEGRMVDRLLMRYGAVNVICLATSPDVGVANIVNSTHNRDEMWEAAGQTKLLDLCQGYHDLYYGHNKTCANDYAEFMAQTKPGNRRHDYMLYNMAVHGCDMAEFADRVLKRLGQLRQKCAAIGYLDYDNFNVVGSPEPTVLIVGDRLNPKDATTRWPFVEYGYSSLFLAEQLHAVCADETKLAYTNANDDNGQTAVNLFNRAGVTLAICLGKAAACTFAATGCGRHIAIPHPAYARRFNRNAYALLLGNALAI